MNKKGFIDITYFMMIIFLIIGLALVQNKIDSSSIDKVKESLNWTRIGANVTNSLEQSADMSDNNISKVVFRITSKFVDFMGYCTLELGKLVMDVARDNPDIVNYKVLFFILFLSLLAPLIYPAFIIIVSLILIIKEWLAKRKERKLLNND